MDSVCCNGTYDLFTLLNTCEKCVTNLIEKVTVRDHFWRSSSTWNGDIKMNLKIRVSGREQDSVASG
jgi:hypothetical protein